MESGKASDTAARPGAPGAQHAPDARGAPDALGTGEPLDPQGQITAYWDFRSASYDAQPGHGLHHDAERRAWLRALEGLLPPAPADVLDVGTGTGFLAWLLAEQGHRVTGVDLAEAMLAVARTKGPGAAGAPPPAGAPDSVVGDAIDPPLPPASVDAVVSRHLLWTLTDPQRAFASWRRLLRPGGRVVAIDGLWRLGQSPAPAPPASPSFPSPSPAPSPPAPSSPSSQPSSPSSPSSPAPAAPAAPEAGAPASQPAEPWREAWARHYNADVQRALPLYDAASLDAVVAAARAAGFGEVRVVTLEEVDRAENASYPDRPPRRPRYVLTATAAGGGQSVPPESATRPRGAGTSPESGAPPASGAPPDCAGQGAG